MSKLLIAFCLLAAVTFAAPAPAVFIDTDAIVPEELVQEDATKGAVAALQDQFNELTANLKSGAKVTPAVRDTINKMIGLVENQIEVGIKTAHATDQQIIDDHGTIHKDLDDSWKVTRSLQKRLPI
jgi:hypothetical protein